MVLRLQVEGEDRVLRAETGPMERRFSLTKRQFNSFAKHISEE